MNKPFSNLAGLLLAATLLGGCASIDRLMGMKEVEIDSMRSAEIAVPSSIANLLIIDRTGYTGNPFDSNEGILITGEDSGEATEAAQTLIYHLQRYLGGSARFQTLLANEILAGNSFNRELPRPIPWETVAALCRHYQADALVAIEVYASEFDVANPRRDADTQQSILQDPRYSQDPTDPWQSGSVRPQYHYSVAAAGNIVFGFRIYHPETETIIDEQRYTNRETWEGTGPDPQSAMENLIERERAIGELIHLAGAEYARRIAPLPVPVTRKYYGESANVPAMAEGSKHAEEGRWRQALEAWEAAISGASEREAGQLAYNVAIAHEALGETDKAREWAQKADTEYGNGQAGAYLSELDEVRSQQVLAEEQME